MASVQMVNRASKPFVKNSKVILTVPRGGKIRRGCVILSGNVVLSAGTTSGVIKGDGGPTNLISRIIVTATPDTGSRYPGSKIVDASPRSLLTYATFQHNGKKIAEQAASVLGSGAAATYPIYLSIPIYWADSTLRNSYSTCLNTDEGTYASVQVEVDTADITACFTGNDRTEDYSGLTVQWVDDRVAFDGDTLVRYQEEHVMLIAATNDRALDDAMPRDGAFESWLIMSEATAAGTLSDSLLKRVTVEGASLKMDMFQGDIKQRMLDDEWIDPAYSLTGLAFMDFTDGTIGNTVPAGGLDSRFSVVNISGASLDALRFFTRRVVAPVKAA